MGPEQRADRPTILDRKCDGLVGENALQQQGVDEDERGLKQVQGLDADFLAVAIGAGEFAVLAVEERAPLAEFQFSTTCNPSLISRRNASERR